MLRLVSLFYLVCLALVAAPRACPADLDERAPGVSVHPLVYDPPRVPLPLLRMRVNDSEPLLFVVDTAWSAPITLDNWVGEKLKLQKTQDTTVLNGSVPLGFVRIDSIELVGTPTSKNVRFQIGGNNSVSMGDLGFLRDAVGTEERIAGVLGVPLLAQATVRFDFGARTLALFWQPHAPVNPTGATTFPMRADRADEPDFRYVTITPVPGQSARLLIDTGATMTSLPASVTARLRPVAAYPTISVTASSLYLEERLLLQELRLGDRAERLVAVHSDNAGDNGGEGTGLLGMDLLSRFRVTLDFRNHRLTLERPADYERRVRLPGDAGIGLRRSGDGYSVETVENNSAAAKAGVRVGDRVLRVDGADIAPFSQNVADHVLDGFAGTPATLVLERQDGGGGAAARRTVRFVRASTFAGPPEPRWGLMWKRAAAGQPFVVTRVVPGTPADRAGLRPGDAILTLNGAATPTMTPQQLQGELGRGEWTLQVRAETDKPARVVRLKVR